MFLICLNRRGCKNVPQFSIVVVNKKSSHKFVLETLGFVNLQSFKFGQKHTKIISIDLNRLKFWLVRGAIMTTRLQHFLNSVNILI